MTKLQSMLYLNCTQDILFDHPVLFYFVFELEGVEVDQLILRDKFKSERYQYSIASDMRSFISMGNGNDPYAEWRVDWFLAFEKGTYSPKARLSPLPASSKSGFDRIYTELNKDNDKVKVAECSKYASHAMSILLSDPKVTDEYNACIAGLGPNQNHNVVLLIPKGTRMKKSGKLEQIPEGTLLVDPWAMAMGYDEKTALAVKPEEYAYSELLTNIQVHYQSKRDPQISSSVKEELTSSSGKELPYKDERLSNSSPPNIGVLPRKKPPLVAPKPVRSTETASPAVASSAPNQPDQKTNNNSFSDDIKQRLASLKKTGAESPVENEEQETPTPRSPRGI
jgi:hypothetical protein